MTKKKGNYIDSAITVEFDMIYPILISVFEELKELSKKKQDSLLNAMKVKMANRILVKVKSILANEPTIEFLELLDEETLPSNSDAVIIIAQFKAAMGQFKNTNSFYRSGKYHWNTEENATPS